MPEALCVGSFRAGALRPRSSGACPTRGRPSPRLASGWPLPRGLRRLAALVAILLVAGSAALAECAPDRLDLRDGETLLRFRVEVVDTDETRARGLMFRETMPRFDGMLFVYDITGPVAFWMKNTLIPLDMLFFDEAGVLTRVHAEAVPGDLTPIPGGDAVRYVLEINGGLAAALGIEPGSEMRHPAVVQDGAAWPCDAG